MSREYTLFLHYKQGDDLQHCLDEADGEIPDAFKMWADHFRQCAAICDKLSTLLEDKEVTLLSDGHSICLLPDNKKAGEVLDVLVKEEILSVEEGGDEDDDEDEEGDPPKEDKLSSGLDAELDGELDSEDDEEDDKDD